MGSLVRKGLGCMKGARMYFPSHGAAECTSEVPEPDRICCSGRTVRERKWIGWRGCRNVVDRSVASWALSRMAVIVVLASLVPLLAACASSKSAHPQHSRNSTTTTAKATVLRLPVSYLDKAELACQQATKNIAALSPPTSTSSSKPVSEQAAMLVFADQLSRVLPIFTKLSTSLKSLPLPSSAKVDNELRGIYAGMSSVFSDLGSLVPALRSGDVAKVKVLESAISSNASKVKVELVNAGLSSCASGF